jgi:hypothetical protein
MEPRKQSKVKYWLAARSDPSRVPSILASIQNPRTVGRSGPGPSSCSRRSSSSSRSMIAVKSTGDDPSLASCCWSAAAADAAAAAAAAAAGLPPTAPPPPRRRRAMIGLLAARPAHEERLAILSCVNRSDGVRLIFDSDRIWPRWFLGRSQWIKIGRLQDFSSCHYCCCWQRPGKKNVFLKN